MSKHVEPQEQNNDPVAGDAALVEAAILWEPNVRRAFMLPFVVGMAVLSTGLLGGALAVVLRDRILFAVTGMVAVLGILVLFALMLSITRRASAILQPEPIPANFRDAVIRLAGSDDLRALGPLLMFHGSRFAMDQGLAAVRREALLRLLRRVRADDSPVLSRHHRQAIVRTLEGTLLLIRHMNGESLSTRALKERAEQLNAALLEYRRSEEFKWFEEVPVALLSALAEVGDRACVPIVRQLTEEAEKEPGSPRIAAAARDCLASIVARTSGPASRLLRPTESAQDSLVRPASGTAVEDSAALLRPAVDETGTRDSTVHGDAVHGDGAVYGGAIHGDAVHGDESPCCEDRIRLRGLES